MSASRHLRGLGPLLAGLAAAAPASAHAFLDKASPPVGATVSTPPTEVRITFTEGVEPAFSRIEVTDSKGVRVDRGAAHLDGAQDRLAVAVGPLAPGAYRVAWHAVATDTHRTEGAFGFEVAP